MRLRSLVAGAVVAGFLSAGVPILAHAQEHQGWGDYDAHHTWHNSDWWQDHHPNWVHKHHPQWAKNGDWDDQHHWHNRDWWKDNHADWAHKHHPDWY